MVRHGRECLPGRRLLTVGCALFAVVTASCSSGGDAPEALVPDDPPSEVEAITTAVSEPAVATSAVADSSTTAPVGASTDRAQGSAEPGIGSTAAARPDPVQEPADGGGWLGRGEMNAEQIQLHWAGFGDDASYVLHRVPRDLVPDPGAPELTAETVVYQGRDIGYLDQVVRSGERYYYFLVVEPSADGTAARWATADAVTDTEPPAPVTGLTLTRAGDEIALRWDQGSDNYEFARYAIRRGIDGGQSTYYGTSWSIDQTSFVDDALPASGTVSYEIIAMDFHGNTSTPAIIDVDLAE